MAESMFYQSTSKEAVKAEQDGRYKQAAQLWINCSFAAYSSTNRQWATHRSEFCLKQLELSTIRPMDAEVNFHV